MDKISSQINRRQFLARAGIGAVVGLSWIYTGSVALGQVRWEQELESFPVVDIEGFRLSGTFDLGEGLRNWQPRLTIDAKDKVWSVWISERDGHDRAVMTSFDGSNFGEEIILSSPDADAIHPAILYLGELKTPEARRSPNIVAVAWSEKRRNGWTVCLRLYEDGMPVAGATPFEFTGAPGAINWHPALAADGPEHVWLVWERKDGNSFEIAACLHGMSGSSEVFIVSPDGAGDCFRPAAVSDLDGNLQVAWDQSSGPGGRAVYTRRLKGLTTGTPGQAEPPIQITRHPAANIAPALAVDADNRLWIAYQSNRKGEAEWDIPRAIYLRCLEDDTVKIPFNEGPTVDLTKEGTDQSFEFPRLLVTGSGLIVVSGRPSHNFCFQFYQGTGWSPLYRVPVDSWGGRGQYMDMALARDGSIWTARREYGMNVLQRIAGIPQATNKPVLLDASAEETGAIPLVNIIKAPRRWPALKDIEGIDGELGIYYGDIHGHTWMSDGMGDVDEFYHARRDYYQHDFASLTDHDTFVRKSISTAEWEFQKAITEHFNDEGRFVTLFGQEWTTGRYPSVNAGHKCIYTIDPNIPLFDHDRSEFRTTDRLYPELKKWNTLVFPHHTGWTGTDWENWDPEIQTLAEICSNHGVFEYPGNTPIPHRGNNPGCFIQDAFARGCRFGLIGGTDSHGLIWHHHAGWKRDCNTTGLACVLAPELTREAIFDALKKRRTFATTGTKPRLDFRVNNHLMGDEFETTDGKVSISVDIAAREDIRWITVVKNNVDFYRYGGEGYTGRFTIPDNNVEPGTSWYYVRIEFDGPEMVWSSPVWVTRV